MPANPFTQVYDALAGMLRDQSIMTDVVRSNNLIIFDAEYNRDQLAAKRQIATADLPELILTTSGIANANLMSTSCTTAITRNYQFLLSTGDYRVNEILFQVEWALLVCLMGWQTELTSLQWNDHSFVKNTRLLDGAEGDSDPERNRNIRGWSALWTCQVDMVFETDELLALRD